MVVYRLLIVVKEEKSTDSLRVIVYYTVLFHRNCTPSIIVTGVVIRDFSCVTESDEK